MSKPTSIQLSHTLLENLQERYILSVLGKRCYKMDAKGKLHLTDEGSEFHHTAESYVEGEELLKQDYDNYAFKPYTDVVIKAKILNPGNQPTLQAMAHIGQHNPFHISVCGPRKAWRDAYGKIRFTNPEPFESVPLQYDYAYGGPDLHLEKKLPPVDKTITRAMPDVNFDYSSIYRYPRNPCGKGYVIENSKEAFEDVHLPQLEYPGEQLTPENIVVGDPFLWPKQPLPRATDWVNYAWFPRIDYYGVIPVYKENAFTGALTEIIEKLAEPAVYKNTEPHLKYHPRGANGASLGLQFPYLRGNETIRLTHMVPGYPDFTIQLPGEAPIMLADGRKGKMIKTAPAIQTLIIDLNINLITLIWQGIAPAIRPYFEEELKTMPFDVSWPK